MAAPKGIKLSASAPALVQRVPWLPVNGHPLSLAAPRLPRLLGLEAEKFASPFTTFREGARWPEARKHTAIPHPPTRKAFRPAHQPAHPPGSTRRTKHRGRKPTTGDIPPGTSTSPREHRCPAARTDGPPRAETSTSSHKESGPRRHRPKREAIPPQPTPRAQKSGKKNLTSSQPKSGSQEHQRKLKEAP
jgi:hypothetical protein